MLHANLAARAGGWMGLEAVFELGRLRLEVEAVERLGSGGIGELISWSEQWSTRAFNSLFWLTASRINSSAISSGLATRWLAGAEQ